MNRMRSTHTFVAVAAGMMLGVSALVQAHAKLLKTEPAADSTIPKSPTEVSLTFNEAPDVTVSKIEISGAPASVKVSKPALKDKSLVATVDGQLPDGVYKVLWATAADDGHPEKGEFSFTLKH